MNDALWPYGRHITAACGELSRIIAAAAKEPGGFAKPIIPSNLGFETIFDLYDQLKSLRDAGGSAASAAIIEVQIMERLLQDDPEALKRGRVDDRLNPFRGMTEAQIIVALNNPLVSDDKKFFYLNKSEIMELILYSNPAFYSLAPQKQREIIDAKVKELRSVDSMTDFATLATDQGRDSLGKIPLALQQLALARERAKEQGDNDLQGKIGAKMDELLAQI